MMSRQKLILVRGGGDIATGTIHRLHGAGFRVLILETDRPTAIRRQVAFCEAVYEGSKEVEGQTAVRIETAAQAEQVWSEGKIPLLIDPQGKNIAKWNPAVVIDAILAKKNLGTNKDAAPLTIALGPGFEAGTDVDYVIETMRGHNLGRIISSGTALPNTGVPGMIGGYAAERVIYASCSGQAVCVKQIGDFAEKDETIAVIRNETGEHLVRAAFPGLIRGMIRDGFPVNKGLKIADIDPRSSEYANCFTISDKARCIAGSVLELVCRYVKNDGEDVEAEV